jgi:hypothetical protein
LSEVLGVVCASGGVLGIATRRPLACCLDDEAAPACDVCDRYDFALNDRHGFWASAGFNSPRDRAALDVFSRIRYSVAVRNGLDRVDRAGDLRNGSADSIGAIIVREAVDFGDAAEIVGDQNSSTANEVDRDVLEISERVEL